MDTIAGINFVPQIYADISAAFEHKRQMLGAPQSQIELMRQRYGMTFLEFMEICSAFRGLQASVRYARRSVIPRRFRPCIKMCCLEGEVK